MKKIFTIFLMLFYNIACAQWNDSFDDGNFTANPTWQNDVNQFFINQNFQLQSKTATAANIITLATASTLAHNVVWEFDTQLNFSFATNNLVRIYLISNQADLNAALNGYFLLISGTGTTFSYNLRRQTGTSTSSIIQSDNFPTSTNLNVKIKVTRNENYEWNLYIKPQNSTDYQLIGTKTDDIYKISQYFGVFCRYTTAARSDKFIFDNFKVDFLEKDIIPPTVNNYQVLDATHLKITFSEEMDSLSCSNTDNYTLNKNAIQNIDYQKNTLILTLSSALQTGDYLLSLENLKDKNGNVINTNTQWTFKYVEPYLAKMGDIVINELFADPSPKVNLPEQEFVELWNTSTHTILLKDWTWSDASKTVTLPADTLEANQYLILSRLQDTALFSPYGKVLGLAAFPSLNNDKDSLTLHNPQGDIIDNVSYTDAWYQDSKKKTGGWTLEKIDPKLDCLGAMNWSASVDNSGGTPGKVNSIYQRKTLDVQLTSHILLNDSTISLIFNQNIVANPKNYQFRNQSAEINDIIFHQNEVKISLKQAFSKNITHHLVLDSVKNCIGNSLSDTLDFYIFQDETPPKIKSLNVLNENSLSIIFSEKMDTASLKILVNYTLNQNFNHPNSIKLINDSVVNLIYNQNFTSNTYLLSLENLKDKNGNLINANTQWRFKYVEPYLAKRDDIVINELFADPSPKINLPEQEFVELWNTSAHTILLKDWTWSDASKTVTLPADTLEANQYLILCRLQDTALFSSYGKVLGLAAFPSLNNDKDSLTLHNPQADIIDNVSYTDVWYQDSKKKTGGWTLEKIDPKLDCLGALNWSASVDNSGGTPGKVNSIYQRKTLDVQLTSHILLNDTTISLIFNQNIVANPKNYQFQNQSAEIKEIIFHQNEVKISLKQAFSKNITHHLVLDSVKNCIGNSLSDTLDFYIFQDETPPKIKSLNVLNQNSLSIIFSKKMDTASLKILVNYTLNQNFNHPNSIKLINDSVVNLIYNQNFTSNTYLLSLENLKDKNENLINANTQWRFKYVEPYLAKRGDIVINELFADPSPKINLPEQEFVELWNTSAHTILLKDWTWSDASKTVTLPADTLEANQYLILCRLQDTALFSSYGKVLGLAAFPSLNNDKDSLTLHNPQADVIDNVSYTDAWYQDSKKKTGGWTLEKIDPKLDCLGAMNWSASVDNSGGTPGKVNSIYQRKKDDIQINDVAIVNDSTLKIISNQLVNISAKNIEIQEFDTQISVKSQSSYPDFITLLSLSKKIPLGLPFTLIIKEIANCQNSLYDLKYNLIITQTPKYQELLISEILFHPLVGGSSFLELYNPSDFPIDLKNVQVATIKSGKIGTLVNISDNSFLIAPKSYAVVTREKDFLTAHYTVKFPERIIVNPNFPTLLTTAGSIMLSANNQLIDELNYDENMHQVFLKNYQGVALERLSYSDSTNKVGNFKSANADAGFATPTYENSIDQAISSKNKISLSSKTLSPNGDGFEDQLQVNYELTAQGMMANANIYNPQGVLIAQPLKNTSLSSRGNFVWDGKNKDGNIASQGVYILVIQIFNNTGKVEQYKLTFALIYP